MSRRRFRVRPAVDCLRAAAVAALLVAFLPLVPQVAKADTASCTPADGEPCLANLAGDDTALPPTPSAVTLTGSGPFSNLKVTVNQTQALLNQAISVTWQGGTPTDTGVGEAAGAPSYQNNFLQIFQCWSADDATGPSPSNCEYGGVESIPGKLPSGVTDFAAFSRQVQHGVTPATYNPADGYLGGSIVYSPFVAVDGTSVNQMFAPYTGPIFPGQPAQIWQNPYYDFYSTNEIDLGRTFGDGTGAELFQVDTGQEAPGLGCGQKSIKQPDGSMAAPKCWLVVVPRGTPANENAADPVLAASTRVATSPLSPQAWADRMTFPLNFDPADSPCAIGAVERRIVGNELATPAITSWQPTLCQSVGLPPFAYASTGDDQARRILVSGDSGAAGMAVVTNPLDPTKLDPANPVVYAPLTLSGLAIGFNVERNGHDKNGTIIDPLEGPLNGTRVEHINLTPRLVAKLLTESYLGSLLGLNLKTATGYDWIKNNPDNLFQDPDFLAYNPEFRALATGQQIDASGLLVEESTSDGANQLWQWILADPEAAAWLNGTPDMTGCPAGATVETCGMKVNPLYSTSPTLNTSGVAFASPAPPNNFPKNDPYCYQTPAQVVSSDLTVTPRPLCVQDTLPYSLSLESAAQATRVANDGSKLAHNVNDITAQTTDTWWGSTGPQIQGSRTMFSVTDTASASRYGLQVASLSRAGDDGATRAFAAPDQQGLTAGAKAMVPSAVTGVLQPSFGAGVPSGAYPLTNLTYAAVTPRSLDAGARSDYAGFVTYAAGPGQVVGLNLGQLPPGYAPLPDALAAQAKAAAALISSGDPGPAPSSTPGTTPAGLGVAGGSISTPTRSIAGSGGQTFPVSGDTIPGAPATTPASTPQPDGVPLQIVKTMATAVGSMRYTLPVALTVAMFAALAAFLLSRKRDHAAPPLPATDV